jgi:hypothetical protein
MDIDREHKEPQGGWEWVKAQEEKKNQDSEKLVSTTILMIENSPVSCVELFHVISHNVFVLFKEEDSRVLDDEPIVGSGMAAALQLASKKGKYHGSRAPAKNGTDDI